MQPVLTFIFIHFGKTHSTKAKKPKLLFSLVKNSVYDLWLVRCSFFICEENHLTYLNLCSFLQINFLFKFSLEKISVRFCPFSHGGSHIISPHVHTHISKTLVLVKKKKLVKSVDKSYMSVIEQIMLNYHPSALCSFFTWLLPGEKITLNLVSSNYPCWGHSLNQ